ncbi:MAG: family 10 glycosylhydrolase [Planctomycetes bacterium]|nr:family 10 glycosylhydrolase [Planctomycetota bacterium]
MLTRTPLLAVALSLSAGGLVAQSPTGAPAGDDVPRAPREFRAAWVATVANIDWPSEPGLSVSRQKQEAVAILDRLAALNMNAVVFQVRPHADAMYRSRLEPWSYYLTGRQGRAPQPSYDPLELWVAEAHARGLQLHAWFNPYRANHPANRGELSAESIVRRHPELVVKLGKDGYYWMDPALEAVQEHSLAVILDVVQRYDVDGVHFDDYFYPYRSYNDGADFPDDASYEAYQRGGGELARDDWRRAAVDRFVERVHREVHAAKPHVEFGISPFGIWRPGHPPGIQGLDQYDSLYADAKRWLNEGWVDYFTPQLYWPIAQVPQSFPVLLGWWQDQNAHGRHLWPGTSIGRARNDAGTTEIVNQVMVVRGMLPADPGLCMFSMKVLMPADAPLATRLLEGPYAGRALIPATPWLDDRPPAAPQVELGGPRGRRELRFRAADDDTFLFVVSEQRGPRWTHAIVPAENARPQPLGEGVTRVAVRAVDRSRNESAAVAVDVD